MKTIGEEPINPTLVLGYGTSGDIEERAVFGLTKREYFAAMAMQALIGDHNLITTYQARCEEAVKYADALIEELNKE